MYYLLCKHKVADYEQWRRVFDSGAEAQKASGLRVLHVLRDTNDPDLVVMLFEAEDLERAKQFTEAPSAGESAACSGIIGAPEVLFLSGTGDG